MTQNYKEELKGQNRVRIVRAREIAPLLSTTRLNDDPTSINSAEFAIQHFTEALVYLTMQASGTPTTLQFIAQFTSDGGIVWYDYLQGIWASMFFEDTILATKRTEVYRLPLTGSRGRIRAIAVGSDGNNFFDVAIRLEMRG